MTMLVNLKDALDSTTYGGKASSLAKLLQADFRIPAGFVVSLRSSDPVDLLLDQILEMFDGLSAEFVAVRSSAVAEDGSVASWAGQLETYLNVTRDDLIEKIELCRKSAHSQRAVEYAKQNHQASGRVAVIVQTMIKSSSSGVAFSVHPVTQNQDQMVIESVLGLGEALVSGEVTPDNYLVSKSDQTIREVHVGSQAKQLVRSDTGKTTWQTIDGSQQKITDEQVIEVAVTVSKIEDYLQYPVDVEWTYAGKQLFILQSRPITTLS